MGIQYTNQNILIEKMEKNLNEIICLCFIFEPTEANLSGSLLKSFFVMYKKTKQRYSKRLRSRAKLDSRNDNLDSDYEVPAKRMKKQSSKREESPLKTLSGTPKIRDNKETATDPYDFESDKEEDVKLMPKQTSDQKLIDSTQDNFFVNFIAEIYKQDLSDNVFDDVVNIKRLVQHFECAMLDFEESKNIAVCSLETTTTCFVCQGNEGEKIKCSIVECSKYYHRNCFKLWPQVHWQGNSLVCPRHVCHTCVSDHPENSQSHQMACSDELAKCVQCPSTYHASISCVPAGSIISSQFEIICSKHYKPRRPPTSATWCFLCAQKLPDLYCSICPHAFHLKCLPFVPPAGAYICEDCESGRLPLNGEVVWVKFGSYRWWPSVICHPNEIPANVAQQDHEPGEFCVKFLGTNDFHWTDRGKVFSYEEDDRHEAPSFGQTKTDLAYARATKEAHPKFLRFKMEKQQQRDRVLKPRPYVEIKFEKLHANLQAMRTFRCECDPNSSKPCAVNSNCINRMLSIECSVEHCPAGSSCHNQDFQRCNYPNMKPFFTGHRGWGLKTLESIRAEQLVIECIGEVINKTEYVRRLKRKKNVKDINYYFTKINENEVIDAELKGNMARFINHSCQPNCETQKWIVNGDTRIGLFALRNIVSGEELTFNYQLQCDGEEKKPCLCGAPNCSGFIGHWPSKL